MTAASIIVGGTQPEPEGKFTAIRRLLSDLPTYDPRGNQSDQELAHSSHIRWRHLGNCATLVSQPISHGEFQSCMAT